MQVELHAEHATERACVLLLVTGLPGAGKSALLDALKCSLGRPPVLQTHHQQNRETTVRVIKLDDLLTAGTPGQRSGPTVFSPTVWQEASVQLREQCKEAINAALRETCIHPGRSRQPLTPPAIVCVEDNMHYASMRASYWKLAKLYVQEGAPLAMIEARVATPLRLCLERNEQRKGDRGYVPPAVITRMAGRFEDGLDNRSSASDLWGGAAEHAHARLWDVYVDTAAPWPTVVTRSTPEALKAKAVVLAEQLAHLLCKQALVPDTLTRQADFLASDARRRVERQHQALLSRAACDSAVHQFDLSLRAQVREYFQSTPDPPSAAGPRRLKSEALEAFKQRLREVQEDDELDSPTVLAQEALAIFTEKLRALSPKQ